MKQYGLYTIGEDIRKSVKKGGKVYGSTSFNSYPVERQWV
jgi:hypothetical protein